MKPSTFIGAAAASAALAFGAAAHAQTQAPTEISQPADQNTLTAVGGSPAPQTAMGAPAGKTREQVYREFIASQHDPEMQQRMKELFRGGQ
ncbi:hypothetical protein [Paraburkholderia sp. HD33-4]|uniref:hypothetical protein n=1 Tax=Paraburkholderia sp. HD33-4 TaxID=2883242 RepID=UPI001F44FCD6|nr:hypothetical protein [Paraburkholderia sp. HD33-4]